MIHFKHMGVLALSICFCAQVACGGGGKEADDASYDSPVQEEQLVIATVQDVDSYSDEGKADDFSTYDPVLHIEPDGVWHSINFVEFDKRLLIEALFNRDYIRGQGSVVIENVLGPVKVTLTPGDVYLDTDLNNDEFRMPMWAISHRLEDGHALILENAYRVPRQKHSVHAVPAEDFLGDAFLDTPTKLQSGYHNHVELSEDDISQNLQISLAFLNFNDSIRVKVEPMGWSLFDEVYYPPKDLDPDAFIDADDAHLQNAFEMLQRLQKSNTVFEQAIEKVNAEIKTLQEDLEHNLQDLRRLEDQLSTRKTELENSQSNRRGLGLAFCAIARKCTEAALVEALSDDSEYVQIQEELEETRKKSTRISDDINTHHTRRSLLEQHRRDLQRTIRSLRGSFAKVPRIAEFDESPDVVRMAHQISVTSQLNDKLKESYAVSIKLRDELLDINWVLDEFITELEEFDAYIEDYIERSQHTHYELLIDFLDPSFDAERWLQQDFQRRIGRLLPKLPSIEKEFNKMLANLVNNAAKEHFTDPDSDTAKMWRDTVLNGLLQNWNTP